MLSAFACFGVTDKLASYRAAMKKLGLQERHHPDGMRQKVLSSVDGPCAASVDLV